MSTADTSALTGTSFGRLTSSAGSRLTESLLSSSGSIAAVGLVTALLTTGFVLWFVLELRQQSTVTVPWSMPVGITLRKVCCTFSGSARQAPGVSLQAFSCWKWVGVQPSMSSCWTVKFASTTESSNPGFCTIVPESEGCPEVSHIRMHQGFGVEH